MSDVNVGNLIVCQGGLYRIDRLTPRRAYVSRIISNLEISGTWVSGYGDRYVDLHRNLIVTTEDQFKQAVAESKARDEEIETAKDHWRALEKARREAVQKILTGGTQ